jgi:murein DD-endopeptidase MepM/ murein hydrolase activator NlpD
MRLWIIAGLALVAACSAPQADRSVGLPHDDPIDRPRYDEPPEPPRPPTPPPAPATVSLDCAGAYAQGGVVVCRTAPGAALFVDGEERGKADADGWAVLGFDRDAGATAEIVVRDAQSQFSKTVPIAPRTFSVQRVDGLPPETVTPTDPEVLTRIARETEIKNKARESRAAARGFNDAFLWPTQGRMSGAWGNQRVLNGVPRTPHYGIDIAAPTGTPIRAPAAGVVALANPDMHFEGGLVMIDHGQGLISYYLHMSRLDVADGQTVTQGQVVGAVGRSGRTTGPHLCWRMRWRDRNLDPSLAVQALQVARAHFTPGATIDAGAPPAGFTPWAPTTP